MQGLELPVPKATQRAAAEAKAKFEASPAGKAAAAAAAAAAGVVGLLIVRVRTTATSSCVLSTWADSHLYMCLCKIVPLGANVNTSPFSTARNRGDTLLVGARRGTGFHLHGILMRRTDR